MTEQEIQDFVNNEKETLREKCKNALFYLANKVLHYNEVCPLFHGNLCKDIESINYYFNPKYGKSSPKQRLWLWARGHFKTSIITVAHTIQLILINPEIRILIAHNKLENAKGVLRMIKNHFTSNDDFRWLFPEYCPKPNKEGTIEFGTTEHFTVPNRTGSFQEPTVDTAGVDTTKTGRHYDYMKKDDIVWEKSVTNEEQLDATRRWDALTIPLFNNPEDGYQDYIGTRYHFADIYNNLLKTDIHKSVIPAWDNNGDIAFKSRYTKEGLEKILKSGQMSPYEFYTQYLLNPIDPEHQDFKEEWLVYRDFPSQDYWNYYICVDPAGEKKEKSDYTVMLVVGIDPKGKRHIIDGIRDKLYLDERLKKLKSLIEKWKPVRVSYERVGMQGDYQEIIRRQKEGLFPYVPIEEVKLSPKETKNDRIRGLQGLFFNKMITIPKELKFLSNYHNKTQDLIEQFKYEYFQFPMCEHDDILDTLSQITRISVIKSEPLRVEKPKPKGKTWNEVFTEWQNAKRLAANDPYHILTAEDVYGRI